MNHPKIKKGCVVIIDGHRRTIGKNLFFEGIIEKEGDTIRDTTNQRHGKNVVVEKIIG